MNYCAKYFRRVNSSFETGCSRSKDPKGLTAFSPRRSDFVRRSFFASERPCDKRVTDPGNPQLTKLIHLVKQMTFSESHSLPSIDCTATTKLLIPPPRRPLVEPALFLSYSGPASSLHLSRCHSRHRRSQLPRSRMRQCLFHERDASCGSCDGHRVQPAPAGWPEV